MGNAEYMGKQWAAGSMAPRNAVEGSLGPPVGSSKETLGKVEEKFQGSVGRSPSPQYWRAPSRSTNSTPRSSSSRCGRSHSERRLHRGSADNNAPRTFHPMPAGWDHTVWRAFAGTRHRATSSLALIKTTFPGQ